MINFSRRLATHGLLALLILSGCRSSEPQPDQSPPILTNLEPSDPFGLPSSGLLVEERRVQRRETVSDILTRAGVSPSVVAELAKRSTGSYDLRRIQAGKTIRLYADSTGSARFFVYEPDPTRYVVCRLTEPFGVDLVMRPLTIRERVAEGRIEQSLYETLLDAAVDPVLANELSEIFAWQIDFHHLQRGDYFKAVFEERLVQGKPAGLGRVLAARFVHRDEDFTAFHFDEEGEIAYFDADGNSLRKEFLMAPVRYSRIASRYTRRRLHPVLKRYRSHLGTDYAAPHGTPIRATGDGVILEAAYKGGNGRYVKIRHNGTFTTGYLHMSRFARGIRRGVTVRQGDIIGYVGSTGLASGPHVCYRFWKNGAQVDPLRQKFPPARPVSQANQETFAAFRDELLPGLFESSAPDRLEEAVLAHSSEAP